MSLRRLLPTLDNAGRRLVLAEVLGQPVSMKRARRRTRPQKTHNNTPREPDAQSIPKGQIDTGYSFVLAAPPQSSAPKEPAHTEYSFVLAEKAENAEPSVEQASDRLTVPEIPAEVSSVDSTADASVEAPVHSQESQVLMSDPDTDPPPVERGQSGNREGADDE